MKKDNLDRTTDYQNKTFKKSIDLELVKRAISSIVYSASPNLKLYNSLQSSYNIIVLCKSHNNRESTIESVSIPTQEIASHKTKENIR